jgi:hypothetical protein
VNVALVDAVAVFYRRLETFEGATAVYDAIRRAVRHESFAQPPAFGALARLDLTADALGAADLVAARAGIHTAITRSGNTRAARSCCRLRIRRGASIEPAGAGNNSVIVQRHRSTARNDEQEWTERATLDC